jgi:GNAT superfamily N-acetyltransferase
LVIYLKGSANPTMTYTIHPLEDKHLEDAARLVSQRYVNLRQQVPLLPGKYAQNEVLLPLLADILLTGVGSAAFQKGRLVGFLSGYLLPEFLGLPSAFSPEWANAAEMQDSRRIYEELYTIQAAICVYEGYPSHLISMLVNDQAGLQGWHWLGFGMVAADAIRPLETIPFPIVDCNIRRATLADVDTIMALDMALKQHLAGSPTYLPHEDYPRELFSSRLQDPRYAFWLAEQGAEPVAYIGFGPASDEACTIIVDKGTTSIPGTYTVAAARRAGIATSLLHHGLEWARQSGYQRSAVDFEPTNPLAARFWLRHYQLVCVTLMRQIIT